jgi:hypothetical protein
MEKILAWWDNIRSPLNEAVYRNVNYVHNFPARTSQVHLLHVLISFLTYTAGFAQIIVSFMILHSVISQKTIIWVFHF